MKVLMVDPPSGWMYGFPRPRDHSMTYEEQLLKSGYPKEGISLALSRSRYWEQEVQE